MKSDQNTSGQSSESVQTSPEFVRSVAQASIPMTRYSASPSPINTDMRTPTSTKEAVLHFVNPKTVTAMIAAWLVVIVGISAIMHGRHAAQLSQAQAHAKVAIVAPLSPDDERRSDIDKLNDKLGEYYGQFGVYPSLDQINSEPFREGDPSFKKIDRTIFMDPLGKTSNLALASTQAQYFYTPTPAGCDSSAVLCSGFSLGATLSSGELYTRQSAQQ